MAVPAAQPRVRQAVEIAVQPDPLPQHLGQPIGQHSRQLDLEETARPLSLGGGEPARLGIGKEIDRDRLAVSPVTRNLQDRRARQAAMGEQRRLAERRLAAARHHIGCHPGDVAEQRFITAQRQRHQRRTRLDDLHAELPRQPIGIIGRPHLGDRRPAGGDDQRRRGGGAVAITDPEPPIGMFDRADRPAQADVHASGLAFIEQHGYDGLGRTVAEQLPQRLFMIGDAVFFDQRDEVRRGVSPHRALGEVRIGRDIAPRHRADIGEVAAPASRNQDLLAHFVGVIDDQHAFAALPRHRGTHQPSAAAAQNDRIIFSVHVDPGLDPRPS